MEKFGSGINIPDTQHWLTVLLIIFYHFLRSDIQFFMLAPHFPLSLHCNGRKAIISYLSLTYGRQFQLLFSLLSLHHHGRQVVHQAQEEVGRRFPVLGSACVVHPQQNTTILALIVNSYLKQAIGY
jgi:hypothetical protein